MGTDRPLIKNATAAGRAENRRVEMVIRRRSHWQVAALRTSLHLSAALLGDKEAWAQPNDVPVPGDDDHAVAARCPFSRPRRAG